MAARYQQENHVTRYPVILYRSVEYTQLCLHVAMRAVALLLTKFAVRNNNGKLLCHCRLVATEVIELAGCHFIACRWLFLAKETLTCFLENFKASASPRKKLLSRMDLKEQTTHTPELTCSEQLRSCDVTKYISFVLCLWQGLNGNIYCVRKFVNAVMDTA